jgi:hypothetical protein
VPTWPNPHPMAKRGMAIPTYGRGGPFGHPLRVGRPLRPMGEGGGPSPPPFGPDRDALAISWPKDGGFGRGEGFSVQNPPCDCRTRMGAVLWGPPKERLAIPKQKKKPPEAGGGIVCG